MCLVVVCLVVVCLSEARKWVAEIPDARGDNSFAISVDLDFLSSATHLRSLLHGGLQENIRYELKGRLAVDIPLVKPIPFSSSGVINMTQSASDQFD